ncbi:MAG: preprotein translocase subunit SecY [Deltaproteobacteria bacterium]|nr:preprotein translocase subunit SecY [Deltaproteobacteria bacterium]
MAGGFVNIPKIPELRKRLLFTLGLLAVYRVGIFITSPGCDREVMSRIVGTANQGLLGLVNMFSGGAIEQMSIFALGIMPYISSSIILQLLTVVVPTLERLKKEGDVGQKKITQYTRYGTILLSIVQGFGIAAFLEGLRDASQTPVVVDPGIGFKLMTVISLTTGTAFIMWLGEQITERGIGNGMSLIIFAGIVARIPSAIISTTQLMQQDIVKPFTLALVGIIMVAVIGVVVFFERGQRRIPVQYAKRVVGRRVMGGQATHLPLKVNMAGVIPPIFASSILMFPATIANYVDSPWMRDFSAVLDPGAWLYNVVYVALIIFFCYFYTAVTFNPVDVADNMKKSGGYIPGIRPGRRTADYIERVLSRITLGGAIYVSAICVIPTILAKNFDVQFFFGGTALLIVVGVALDTVQQIESHLITRHYTGFTGPKGPRIRGRRTA